MTADLNPPTPKRVLRLPVVEDRSGLKCSTIYALMGRGLFPQPIRLTARSVAWREADIDQWIESREPTREALGGKPRASVRAGVQR